MAETSTFSALIDDAIARSQRRDRITDIVAYARSSIRECQVLAYFEQDLVEDSLNVDAVPFEWERPINLRTVLAAKPQDKYTRRDNKIYFKNLPPGQRVKQEPYYLYLSGNTYIFTGDELVVGDVIDISYFTYARRFVYYETANRPATYDPETETWSYHADYAASTALQEQAEALVQNWLVFHWYDMLLEGTLAKLFKTVNDERNRTAYSLFKSMQADLLKGERVIYLQGNHDVNG